MVINFVSKVEKNYFVLIPMLHLFGEWISGWFTLGILKGVKIASGSCRKVATASGRGDGGRGDLLSAVTSKIKQLYVQPFQVSMIPT